MSFLEDDQCPQDENGFDVPRVLEGVFSPGPGATEFTVTGTAEEMVIGGVAPAIPAGTFVRVRYQCTWGGYGSDPGAYVMIENLPTLAGADNPAGPGTRLWYFVEAGGQAYAPAELPFELDYHGACGGGTFDTNNGGSALLTVDLSGQGVEASAPPGEAVGFVVTSGEQAGAYSLSNHVCQWVLFPGGDTGEVKNLEISRAD